MAKITALEQKTYLGKPSGFRVTLDTGASGNLEEKSSDQGLQVGEEVAVTLIPYTSKAGKQSTLIGLRRAQAGAPVQQAQQPVSNVQTPQIAPPRASNTALITGGKGIVEMKHESRIAVIEVLGKLASEGKIEPKDITEFFNQFYPAVDLSYDCIA